MKDEVRTGIAFQPLPFTLQPSAFSLHLVTRHGPLMVLFQLLATPRPRGRPGGCGPLMVLFQLLATDGKQGGGHGDEDQRSEDAGVRQRGPVFRPDGQLVLQLEADDRRQGQPTDGTAGNQPGAKKRPA